ncbi:hypothetical protein BZA05DRAFT_73645 [Tricharina praecox]|uniref:uncharacterized protein n=1 Tax=Tricharina praecox TaxID=43433 RepID=UPI00221FDA64|nr:uncharacterized protein BZA05DRAFT_73645 [Tricharina praecox]KAI5849695.1 hypothetical protein BZA05DRAFT_73645 [Tricharina praecox]
MTITTAHDLCCENINIATPSPPLPDSDGFDPVDTTSSNIRRVATVGCGEKGRFLSDNPRMNHQQFEKSPSAVSRPIPMSDSDVRFRLLCGKDYITRKLLQPKQPMFRPVSTTPMRGTVVRQSTSTSATTTIARPSPPLSGHPSHSHTAHANLTIGPHNFFRNTAETWKIPSLTTWETACASLLVIRGPLICVGFLETRDLGVHGRY